MKLHVHQPVFVMNRVGALLIDMFIISLVYGAAAAVISGEYKAVFDRFQVSLGDARYDMLLALVIMAAYFVLLPLVWNGRTIGSRFLRIQLLKESGEAVGAGTLLWRFCILVLSNVVLLGIPAIVNIYIMLLRRDNRGYHDLAARTKVISNL
ncbi:RDD family protein [Ectobacillus funiculus]|uniref:RDD family protein n=1 Tax=Ectobacillus funiculus TaxID=137993 RepID=A0ABV5WN72_9BACI